MTNGATAGTQPQDLTGKVVMVTGAARGIGAAIAERVVSHGGSVIAADVNDDGAKTLASRLGDRCVAVHLDVRREDEWRAAVETATDTFGGLDGLVNNAALAVPMPLMVVPMEEFTTTLDVNLTGAVHGIRACAGALAARGGGSIVNIASIEGLAGTAGMGAYVASKFALRGITKVAALELTGLGIRVNAICPGPILTPAVAEFLPGMDPEAIFKKMVPMGRMGQAGEIADMAVFLLSDRSSYCTGGDYPVDGGVTAAVAQSLADLLS